MKIIKSPKDGKECIMVPWESMDDILREIHDLGDSETKEKVKKLSRSIMLRGIFKRKDKNGNDIYFLEVPLSWYKFIKQQYEIPI